MHSYNTMHPYLLQKQNVEPSVPSFCKSEDLKMCLIDAISLCKIYLTWN